MIKAIPIFKHIVIYKKADMHGSTILCIAVLYNSVQNSSEDLLEGHHAQILPTVQFSLLSVGPGADPGVQAVSPQVT